jgi:hypothetical protein
MKTLEFTKPNSLDQLRDELETHGIKLESVEGKEDKIWLTVSDDTDEASIQAVIDAHLPQPVQAPPDFKAMMDEIEAIDTTVDLDAPTNFAQLKAATKLKFQKLDQRQQKIVNFQKARAGLK